MAFEGLSGKLSAVFKKMRNKGKLKESDIKEAMREVRLALLEADVNYKVAKDFVAAVSEKAVGDEVLESLTPAQMVVKIVNDELTNLMGETGARLNFSSRPPTIVMMCGLQGSGKTTHSAKLALHFREQGKRPLLVACDGTARPLSSSSRWSAKKPASRCSIWGRATRLRSRGARSCTRRTMATTL